MAKPSFQFATDPDARKESGRPETRSKSTDHPTPLAALVSEHLRAKGLRQIDFCRSTGFDQGLLSKILSSVVSTLNVETALKLAAGLQLQPAAVFEAIGKRDVDEMLRRFYVQTGSDDAIM